MCWGRVMSQAPLYIVGGTGLFRRGLCSFLEDTPFRLTGEYDSPQACVGALAKAAAPEAEIIVYVSNGDPEASAAAVDALLSCADARVLVLSGELSVDEPHHRVHCEDLADIAHFGVSVELREISVGQALLERGQALGGHLAVLHILRVLSDIVGEQLALPDLEAEGLLDRGQPDFVVLPRPDRGPSAAMLVSAVPGHGVPVVVGDAGGLAPRI